ncbi:DnaD domain-containing protein [Mycoplasma sp. P36-A1]|uniref:DnaD domain-containing protein n=1 Tax=Mycoplasma sp. P36-A1 TaxID=3252900 RepID=UPI003C2FEA0D
MINYDYLVENNIINKYTFLLQNYKLLNLDEKAVILIMHIEDLNNRNINISSKVLAKVMSLTELEINTILNELFSIRKILSITNSNDTVHINTNIVYEKLMSLIINKQYKEELEKENKSKQNIIKTFEQELRHKLSPLEVEIVREWCENFSEELVIDSLKTAVVQGVLNLNYIEKIIINKAELLNV